MPFGIPEAKIQEHEELHGELKKATKIHGRVGKAASRVAEVLHPHLDKENELALPIIGIMKELSEGKESNDFSEAAELFDRFRSEYENMLKEHSEFVAAVAELEAVARKTKKTYIIDFARKLRLHAKVEGDLRIPPF